MLHPAIRCCGHDVHGAASGQFGMRSVVPLVFVAAYFRSKIKEQQVQQSMDPAVVTALKLRKHSEASYLPG